ncbi:hypothetical protein PR202_ga29661 [Eleusine coracana subsp. coracana]|uniref:Bifunctional inhibitor/plant lipid transfer protein/seed storage helical domain-containing protein n=1 Tax=Eleusine coracana subsp. coracana TaxID=191504 RepID=A0AAV5DM60_ELECO|nr:hypothetical protein QOZ80_7AG0571140 [Eleusine coracana subsp. coracana]GJN11464.1 hypothetical protein PR202_ga29661 [Eleusine coracana subsp. coracana]
MGPTAALLLVLAAAAVAPAHASSAPPPAESAQDAAARCAAAIVSISPCLPHVAVGAPPSTPTDACCVAFLRAVSPSGGGGGEGCLCHLLRDPLLLGFPVDAARLGALLPACAAGNSFAAATVETATLFADACRAAAVPELVSVPTEKVPSGAPLVPSGAPASCSCNILLAALIVAAAGAVITAHL